LNGFYILNELKHKLGEKSLQRILEYAEKIADRALPDDGFQIRRACSDITSMTNSLCELHQNLQVPFLMFQNKVIK